MNLLLQANAGLSYIPVAGNTDYDRIRRLADELLRIVPGEESLLALIRKRKIPGVGIPLDANQCMRWMGRFKETSVNLELLGELVN